MTARTRCGWAKIRESGEVLYGIFPLRLKGAAYKSYVRPAILIESEIGILQRTERSTVRVMCGVQLKDSKRFMDFMFMLRFNETTYQLAMANSVRWYGNVLRREDGHVLRRELDFEVKCQRKVEDIGRKGG